MKNNTLTIRLTEEESLSLQALAIDLKTTPENVIGKFISDLTGSLRSNGSDERQLAEDWVGRNYWPGPELTEAQHEQVKTLQSQAYRVRKAQQAAWRAELEAKGVLKT